MFDSSVQSRLRRAKRHGPPLGDLAHPKAVEIPQFERVAESFGEPGESLVQRRGTLALFGTRFGRRFPAGQAVWIVGRKPTAQPLLERADQGEILVLDFRPGKGLGRGGASGGQCANRTCTCGGSACRRRRKFSNRHAVSPGLR